MKLNHAVLESSRFLHGIYGSPHQSNYGAFLIDGPCGIKLKILASSGDLCKGSILGYRRFCHAITSSTLNMD